MGCLTSAALVRSPSQGEMLLLHHRHHKAASPQLPPLRRGSRPCGTKPRLPTSNTQHPTSTGLCVEREAWAAEIFLKKGRIEGIVKRNGGQPRYRAPCASGAQSRFQRVPAFRRLTAQEMAPVVGNAPTCNCLTGSPPTCGAHWNENWSGRQVTLLLDLAPKASASLLGYVPMNLVFLPRFALGAHPSQGCVILLHHRNRQRLRRNTQHPTPNISARGGSAFG